MICRTSSPLFDLRHRPVRDLRISVTDRCGFRCPYCMPPEDTLPAGERLPGEAGGAARRGGPELTPRADILDFEEITRLARLFARLGVRKVRLTGGEPLLRRGLVHLVGMLAGIEGIEDLALTTNGQLLAGHAESLAAAGLRRITVSLDSLDPERFHLMSGGRGKLREVLAGIETARGAGLDPIKLNTVLVRGVNDVEIVRIARFARDNGLTARFIEYMDVGNVNRWQPHDVVTAAEILARLAAAGLAVHPVSDGPGDGHDDVKSGAVARRYAFTDGHGEIGIIASISQPFCGTCTRIRVSPEGRIYTCLFASEGYDARALLRGGASDREIASALEGLWRARRDRYSEERAAGPGKSTKVEMYRIGG